MKFIDPDTVEAKNVGRQLFTPADIGKNKAEVLARRYNRAFGLRIEAIPHAFSAREHGEQYSGTVLCGAVDNHEARQELAQLEGTVWIDAGNHRASGQVVIGNCDDWEDVMRQWKYEGERVRYLPSPALVFPELLEPPEEELPSCAEMQMQAEQSLFINGFMAQIASDYLYKLLNREPITTFMTTFNAEPLAMRSHPITLETLQDLSSS